MILLESTEAGGDGDNDNGAPNKGMAAIEQAGNASFSIDLLPGNTK